VQNPKRLCRESMSQSCKYRFGAFELRTQTRELYKHGVRLKLRPQAYFWNMPGSA
jgi:hypothetical protein